jgi:lipoyl(octanoyl) transferase
VNSIQNRTVRIEFLEMIDFQKAWDYQTDLFDEAIAIKVGNRSRSLEQQRTTSNHLLFCEHPHVYTLGKSGDENNLLIRSEKLHKIGATFYPVNRGGDITYHGPGQIVGYPILDLENFFTDIHLYLRHLEEAVIATLAEYNIAGGRIEGLTGVWIDKEGDQPRKICALGVKSSRWVTMHGFALNVNTDLSYFDNIIPCGISDKAVTSIKKELGIKQDMHEVREKLVRHLLRIFQMEPAFVKTYEE